jgi:hypothetical protein
MTDYVELANTRNDRDRRSGTPRPHETDRAASNALPGRGIVKTLWISVSHAACCQRANAGPDQSSLDFRSSSAGTQTIQLARGQTMSRSCSPPRFRRGLLAPVRRGAGLIPAGLPWSDHRSGQLGRDHVRAPESAALSRGARPDCGPVARPRCGCRTPESARRVAQQSREGRAGPHPVGVMRAPEGGCTMASGTGMTWAAPREWSDGPVLPKLENVYGRGRGSR